PLHSLGPSQRARAVAYLEQRPLLHWPLRVQQVVELARLAFGDRDVAAGAAAIAAALKATGAVDFAARDFQQLSEGEKLLVNLTRALAGEPQLLLADEPTAALDPANQHSVMQLLRTRAATGMGVIVVLHDLTLAARYCDRLLLLHSGSVIADGVPADVLSAANLQHAFQIDAHLDGATNTVIVAGKS
ncbi:MAG: ABC transporter ATP-binding protein, partial [Pseudomonadota bacterium]